MKQMTDEEIKEHERNPNILIKIKGKTYRCPYCNCNVFHHPGTDKEEFACNSCQSLVYGEI
jgi:hypothetical protein